MTDNLQRATDIVVKGARYYREARPGYQYAVRYNGRNYMAGDTHELVAKVRDAMKEPTCES